LSGIYNVGTGRAQTFNDVATATVNALRRHDGKEPLTTAELVKREIITYIPFPEALVGKYQSYTQANVDALRETGYTASTYDVAQGASRYVEWLLSRARAG
jgi:ADP-L-glycero-D-manno-heptose 6-epimerase